MLVPDQPGTTSDAGDPRRNSRVRGAHDRGGAPRWRRFLRWYGGLLLLSAVYLLTAVLLRLPIGDEGLWLTVRILALTVVASLLYLTGRLLWCSLIVLKEDPRVSRSEGWRRTRERLVRHGLWERLATAPALVVAIGMMWAGFLAFKPSIPLFAAYRWDPPLATLDEVLHLGFPPWEVSHALPFQQALTDFLDTTYLLWFDLKLFWAVAAVLFGSLYHRARTFMTYVLVSIIAGTGAAIAFASGGPVYYGQFTGDFTRFAPLLANLEGTRAAVLQARLWATFQGQQDLFFPGISAMPSIHVAMGVLMAIWGWGVHRGLGVALGIFAAIIMVGSVHLGWHYAVDGYAAVPMVAGCWWLAGKVLGPESRPGSSRESP